MKLLPQGAGDVADACLLALIVLAPVAGGSSHPWMLPILGALGALAYGAALRAGQSNNRRLHLTNFPLALLVLAVFTVCQLLPLPPSLLGLVSARAVEIYDLVGDRAQLHPLSYEVGATAREAAKLVLLAMVAMAASERAKVNGFRQIAQNVVIAGLASAAVALVHRGVGAQRMLGLLRSQRPADQLVSTFVNPNHAAGFLVFCSIVALGLALGKRERSVRLGAFGASLLLATASLLSLSRGGLGALVVGLAAAGLLLWLRPRDLERHDQRALAGAALATLVLFAAGVITYRFDAFLREWVGTTARGIATGSKVAAMKDAWPMIGEHWSLGIGRGSYVSLYPLYKTSPHQFTFTHPENIVVQLLADWGVFVGGAALVALGAGVVMRARRARQAAELTAIAAIIALLLQNLVDFSLELLGVAVPAAATFGAIAVGSLDGYRLSLGRPLHLALAWLLPVTLCAGLTAIAFEAGDLFTDQARLQALVDARARSGDRAATPPWARAIAARHPANAIITAQLSYLAETSEPPDHEEAIRWANRTLYLSPTYADGHVAIGRILIKAGHRAQGFAELKEAWRLAGSAPQRESVLQEVLRLARGPGEVWSALPRRDLALDLPEESEVARAVRELRRRDELEWARALLHGLDPRSVASDALHELAIEAVYSRDEALAATLLERRLKEAPDDARALTAMVDIWNRTGEAERAKTALADLLGRPGADRLQLLRLLVNTSIGAGDLPSARAALIELRLVAPPTESNQIAMARLESAIELKAGRPGHAVTASTHAIQLAPSSPYLRVDRARAYLSLGRHVEARNDLQVALRHEPQHSEARALLAQIEREIERTAPPAALSKEEPQEPEDEIEP